MCFYKMSPAAQGYWRPRAGTIVAPRLSHDTQPTHAVAMKWIVTIFMQGLVAASIAAAQDMPSELAALTAKARLSRPVTWCRAEFRSGHAGAFAVAVVSADGGGRYVALDSDGSVTELGAFKRSADLSCYSRAQAEKLDASIKQSNTITGTSHRDRIRRSFADSSTTPPPPVGSILQLIEHS